MKPASSHFAVSIGPGVAAGLTGTMVMMAMRFFDQRYAPKTIPRTKEDPGVFVVNATERAIGMAGAVPPPIDKFAALAIHTGYGTVPGALYALWRGRDKAPSALRDGILLGILVYAASYLGLLPILGLTKPLWKQKFPAIAGELLRHITYGVATTATYGIIEKFT